MVQKNRKGEAVSVSAYQEFILKAVHEHGGIIREEVLDEIIEEAYGKHWGPTDLEPWGRQGHSKWKQNVASAKSGLDRRAVVVRYVRMESFPVSHAEPGWKVYRKKGVLYRFMRVEYRVALPERFVLSAYDQWQNRFQPKKKKAYDKLKQPIQINLVPA